MQKTWLNHYPPGVPAEIDPDAHESVRKLFEQAVQRFDKAPAFTHGGRTLSFADVNKLSLDLAAYLQKVMGLGKGDCMAIMLPIHRSSRSPCLP